MDFYQEQHSYTLAQNANANSDNETDEDTSWVMMGRDGEVVKLPGEKIFYKVRSRIGLDVNTPKALPNAPAFTVKSDSGLVYITNNRVIYLPNYPTEAFKSFSAPILDFEDSRVASSFFGPWTWNAIVKPTPGGGIPASVPRLELKLTFREGGHDAFQSKFEVMKERLAYARTLQQETGQVIPTGEDLPRYEPPAPGGPSAAPEPQTPASTAGSPQSADKEREALESYEQSRQLHVEGNGHGPGQDSMLRNQAVTPTPDEPPPNYEEAQAQVLNMVVESAARGTAERE